MTEVTNISGGLLVCDLESGDTLRLENRKSVTLKDSDITRYFENLAARGRIRLNRQVQSPVHNVAGKEE